MSRSSHFEDIVNSLRIRERKSGSAKRRSSHRQATVEPLEPRLLLFANPIHKALTIDALPFIKDEVIADINDEHTFQEIAGLLDQDEHFDGNHFEGAAAEINVAYNTILDEADPESFDSGDIPDKFGQLLHAVQDFYAHSNWVNLGQTTLIESGTELWNALLPYSIHDGAMLIEGEDETPTVPGLGTATLRRTGGSGAFPGFRVEVDFGGGTVFKGVISGTFGPDHSPDNISIGHYDPTFGSDRGLNKDDPSRDLHTEARSLAVSQTIQEFRRLGALIDSRYGPEGICKLLEEWVKPDDASQAQAREILGVGPPIDLVFVIDTTGSMSDDIAAVKAAATEIIDRISEESPCYQVAIILYKDAGDVYVTQTALAFTNDADAANAAIQSISVSGGGDFPEAVFAALDHAILNLDGMGLWRGGAVDGVGGIPKKVILMGDAPPHDPDLATGATAASVAQHAFDADPVDIYPIVIGNDSSAVASFQAIADANRGELFVAATADDVVDAILDAIDVIGGGSGLIQGRKWLDTNQNGTHDGGEEWLNGWTVDLLDSTGTVVATTSTMDFDLDGNGTIDNASERGVYRFTGLDPGDYEVREIIPTGWIQTFPASPSAAAAYAIDVDKNLQTTENDFLDWGGLNERWIFSDSGWYYVTPAGGLFFWLGGRGDSMRGNLVAKLTPEYYEDLELIASSAPPQTHDVTIAGGSPVTGIDFGNTGASSIQGRKWEDINSNGTRENSERWLNGWEIQLVDAITGSIVSSTMTRDIDLNYDGIIDPQLETGTYLFDGVIPGRYEVREVLKAGWFQSTPTKSLLTLAHDLDTARLFRATSGEFQDWGHLNEKWLQGSDGWYFITPDGTLNKWNRSPRTALTGTKVAQLTPYFYYQLLALTDAKDPVLSVIDISNEVHRNGVNIGNSRTNGAHGLKIYGNDDPALVPGNVKISIWWGRDIYVTGDNRDNQVALFVDWQHNLVAVGLQGTTVNGQSAPVVLLANTTTVPGILQVDLYGGNDLVGLQGFTVKGNARIGAGYGVDSTVILDMNFGWNLDVQAGYGAGIVGISNTSVANNLYISGSETKDTVALDRVVVSNYTVISLGWGNDQLVIQDSAFHDDAWIWLDLGDDVFAAQRSNAFSRLLFVDGSWGNDAWSAGTLTAGRRSLWSLESNSIPGLDAILDEVLATFDMLGVDASVLD